MTDVAAAVADARTVLLRAPSMTADEGAVCGDLLLAGEPAATSVLWVTFRRDARACVDQWAERADDSPRNATVIAVGDAGEAVAVEWARVEPVRSASDLTGLGIAIGEFLADAEGDVAVCFDSLSAMLQYVDVETAYEFLHAITGQFYAAEARAHFHVDPTAHDDRTVAALTSLFDATVSLGDGEPSVRTREVLG